MGGRTVGCQTQADRPLPYGNQRKEVDVPKGEPRPGSRRRNDDRRTRSPCAEQPVSGAGSHKRIRWWDRRRGDVFSATWTDERVGSRSPSGTQRALFVRFLGVRFEDVRGLCWRFKVNKPRLRRGAFSSVAQLVEAIEIWLSTGTPTQAAYLALRD